jgi:hypothetical protein
MPPKCYNGHKGKYTFINFLIKSPDKIVP